MVAGPSHLKPGEKGRITARLAPLPVKGVVNEKIEVVSNDPKRSRVMLTLHAHIIDNLLPALQRD